MPFKGQPLVVDTVNGAEAIQNFLDDSEWAQQAGNPEGWAPYISMPVIYPVRARRQDRAEPDGEPRDPRRAPREPDDALPQRPHGPLGDKIQPAHVPDEHLGPGQTFAYEAQDQIATFFASDGATTIDPDGAAPYFETPSSIFPEDLAFIP